MQDLGINWRIVKPSLWAGAGGMALGALLLTYLFGFMSPSTAEKLAARKSDKAVVAALAPGCAEEFRSLPDADDRMAKLVANRDSYLAREAFPKELITLPGKSYVDYSLVRACTALLVKPKQTES
ncbi:hypothetical protein [Bradyrhizobium sp. LMTR 3]|uniref:hypothetical protein n=1 Tax=Bradyrhizobium sp. LMTR 3 TaxID=189873 RepID=UPI000810BA32|nr:hypothetical protein [Bradyrhizobium sp. LMTR 3]OCK55008.1 hypothetical protein LMTR3_09540 [Bradyrhizobium sp. LMTR 3]